VTPDHVLTPAEALAGLVFFVALFVACAWAGRAIYRKSGRLRDAWDRRRLHSRLFRYHSREFLNEGKKR
jgi:hypothetical protein